MSEQTEDSLGSGVVLEEHLPVAWAARNAPLEPQRAVSLQNVNERVLNTMLAVEENDIELPEEYPGKANELQRMEFKVNLILDLVSQLLTHHLPMPPRAPVRLGADRIEWGTKTAPTAGQAIIVEVYLDVRFPRPVMLPARVASVEPRAQGVWVLAKFEQLGDPVTNLLEKLIFRSHRRHVASHRQRGGTPS